MLRFLRDKFAWFRFFKDDSLGRRLLVGLCILLALFFFIHIREIYVYMPKVGTKSKMAVTARIDFQFPDEKESMLLRREVSKDVGQIYRISPRALKERSDEYKNMLMTDDSWRADLGAGSEAFGVLKRIREFLSKLRFADQRSLNKLNSLDLGSDDYYPLPSSYNEKTVHFPDVFWADVESILVHKNERESVIIAYLLEFFAEGRWPLDRDLDLQTQLRDAVEKSLPHENTEVQEGSLILSKGEEVDKRHLVMLEYMKKALEQKHRVKGFLPILGNFLISLMIVTISAFYFHRQQKKFLESLSKLSLYAAVLILTLLLAKVAEYFFLRNQGFFSDMLRYPLFIPFIAILTTALLNVEIAVFTSAFLGVIMGFTLAVNKVNFISINLVAGLAAVLLSGVLRKRKQVFGVCAKIWLLCVLVLFSYKFDTDRIWSPEMMADMTGTLFFLAITAILVVGLLPILESLFRVMTDITLMEFMDPNNELLRRLSIEAPGTYQHCLVVGSIAEAAAQSIGANGLFCRVSTLYHDVGKLLNPHYFTENQMGGFNIHQLLTPTESAQVIISHVTEGEALAKKYSLPRSFIDVILEHHGTTLVYYFYCKQVELMGGDESAVDEKAFRYPGPKPHSKESAIIMMADTVEAASRSLDDVNENTLMELVDRLVGEKLEDGQFDECQLTFEEFGKIKRTMVKSLALARHVRIKFPERKSKKQV
jgi:cyclic-di-AMP phosphodiesterase PgpH